MSKKFLALFVCVLLSIACSMAGISPHMFGNSYDGWICFESGKDIWVMRTDGSQLQNITNTDSVWETSCKLSWDSRQILYSDSDDNLYLINRNGTGKQTLLDNGGVKDPSWSPDGTKIVYVRMDAQNGTPIMSVHILDIASNEDAKIYESSPEAVIGPVISPDGTKIAFTSGGIYTMDVNGSDVQQILAPLNDEYASYLSWSRDGKKIAFATTNGVPYGATTWAEYGNIYVINADGSGLANLTNSAPDPATPLSPGKNIFKFGESPCWTNGNQVLFLSNMDSRAYTMKPYIMNSDGTSTKLLIDQEMKGMDYQPDAGGNSTPVPTTVDISTSENSSQPNESATEPPLENSIFVSSIILNPNSPASLSSQQKVSVSFNYSTTEKDGVYIWVRPVTNGQLSPNYRAHGSPIYPFGTGKATGYFTFENETVYVDQIYIYMKSADQKRLLAEVYVDVNYTFTP